MTVLIVTGTGTDVGKTIATAALAACAARTKRVAVVKPAQTGEPDGGGGDLAAISRLARVADTFEYARYPDPLSPHQAAYVSGRRELDFAETVRRIDDLAAQFDLVLVEGAGGLMVPYDFGRGWTLIDLAHALHVPLVVVTQPGLGTLNHTALTLERLHDESLDVAGLIIGSWPAVPDLAMRLNVEDLVRMAPDGQLAGVLPAGMATMRDFRTRARAAIAPQFGGTFDSGVFRTAVRV